MSTDDTDPSSPEELEDSERRSFMQGMVLGGLVLSHSTAGSDDGGWFGDWFGGSDDSPGAPGFFTDVQYRHEDEVVIEDPKIVDFVGDALDVKRPNHYDEGIRIKVDGDVAVAGEDIAPKSVTTESVGTERVTTTQLDRHKVDGRWGERFTTHGRLVDNVEDLTNWTVTNGTLEADTSRVHRGTQSAKMTGGTDGQILIQNDTVSLDLSRNRLAAAVWVEESTDPGKVMIICDDGNNNTMYTQAHYRPPDAASRGWRYLDFGWERWVDTSIDMSNIQNIRIHMSNDIDGLWMDGLKAVPAPSPALLMLGFDDGNVEDYTLAREVVSEYNWSATSYIVPSKIGNTSRMDLSQLRELHEDYGWTIASHLNDFHTITGLSESEARATLEDAKAWLQENGFHEGGFHLSWPGNEFDQQGWELAQEYHMTARYSSGLGVGYPLNPLALPSQNGDGGLTTELQNHLDFMADFGGVGALHFHSSDVTESDLRAVLDHVQTHEQNGDVRVITPDDLGRGLPAWHTTTQPAVDDGTEAGAVAIDATGIQTVTVSHNLPQAPAPEDVEVFLTNPSQTDWNGYVSWIDGISASSFDVHVYIGSASGTAGATADLSWTAQL